MAAFAPAERESALFAFAAHAAACKLDAKVVRVSGPLHKNRRTG